MKLLMTAVGLLALTFTSAIAQQAKPPAPAEVLVASEPVQPLPVKKKKKKTVATKPAPELAAKPALKPEAKTVTTPETKPAAPKTPAPKVVAKAAPKPTVKTAVAKPAEKPAPKIAGKAAPKPAVKTAAPKPAEKSASVGATKPLKATAVTKIAGLPPGAKLLTKAEIMSAYGGKTAKWSHPYTDKLTGVASFDKALSASSGTWSNGNTNGEWEAKLTMKGDQYCYQVRGKGETKYNLQVCNIVYLAGSTFYELDPKTKKILSVNKLIN